MFPLCVQEVMKKAWCNLSSQQIVPTFDKDQFPADEKKQIFQYIVSDGFNGGGCVELHGSLDNGQVHRYK